MVITQRIRDGKQSSIRIVVMTVLNMMERLIIQSRLLRKGDLRASTLLVPRLTSICAGRRRAGDLEDEV